jgi:putative ABC transport system permease protein
MKAINVKLLRELRQAWGQAVAIAMVIAGGVATFIMSVSVLDSLVATREAYYRDYRFADVFASAKRAPESLRERIEEIPGVDRVQTRVVAAVKLRVEGFEDPVNGRAVSLPDHGEPQVNRLYLRSGRMPDPDRDDEAVLNEVFADAHGLRPGDRIEMIVHGRLQPLRVTGIALSPEFIYQISPTSIMPDFKRYGVLWMTRSALESAGDMDGAFNDVVLTLIAGAEEEDVIERLDLLLADYGGLDAQGRYWQISHRFLESEFDQLRQMARMFSTIFLGVAAFLLNVVLSRLISTQRESIAALKAFGYGNLDVALHYLGFVSVIATGGLVAGTLAGMWMGEGMSRIYMDFYRFPALDYRLRAEVLGVAAAVTLLAAAAGTLIAVRRAAHLPPAEAMRPEAPAKYRRSLLEVLGPGRLLSQPSRMIVRHLERNPVKSALTVVGIALACSIMVVGTFFRDAIDFMIDIEFGLAQRQDVTVTFIEPTSRRAFHELRALPGVEYAEAYRSVPVRLLHGHRSYRTAINGYQDQPDLHRLLDLNHRPIRLSPDGLVMTDHLARILHVNAGDVVIAEVLEGRRPVLELPVAGLVSQYFGVSAYMDIEALNRIMREGEAISGAYLRVDPESRSGLFTAFRDMPRVAGAEAKSSIIDAFYETSAEFILIFVGFISTLAGIITFGVVYNSARIALAERSRELASMRVLGFTRGEISFILLGELAVLTLLAIPVGLVIGRLLCRLMVMAIPQDLFRVPLIIEPSTYALAATVVIIASLLSSLAVRSRLDHLDLVAVLKAQE